MEGCKGKFFYIWVTGDDPLQARMGGSTMRIKLRYYVKSIIFYCKGS